MVASTAGNPSSSQDGRSRNVSRTITLDLPDNLYAGVAQAAAASGQTPGEWLRDNLPALLPAVSLSTDEGEDVPKFWQMPEAGADWEALQAVVAERRRDPPSHEVAVTETNAMLAGWFGGSMTEAEALELAMSEALSEWNLDS
jgi:hypothetical protein